MAGPNPVEDGGYHFSFKVAICGDTGVGKTTLARILAKCLNCEVNGVSSEPCGKCDSCLAIDAGQFVDLYEVDAASRTKVEDTRDLLENVQYMPTQGRYKIYLIDEVQSHPRFLVHHILHFSRSSCNTQA